MSPISLEVSLNCWVIGEQMHNTFSVDIESRKKVSALKELIKEEKRNQLGSIDANELMLFKIDVPEADFDKTLKEVGSPSDVEHACLLDPLLLITELFECDPPVSQIHIMVQIPEGNPFQPIQSSPY
jgi:hypothetical protein